jgi:uncharacterized protein involved in response to NO
VNTRTDRAAYSGPALFSYGFRPFFLFGAIWAAITPLLWVASLAGHAPLGLQLTLEWHAHEMLFGYTGAIVAGFLTTSIPNWTGRMPIIGAPLAALFGLWVLGRAAMLFSAQAPVAAAVADTSFLAAFAAAVWREILAGKNWRNAPVALLASLLAVSNLIFHLRILNPDFFALSERLAMGVIALLIALIGGRITPSFTRNWLAQRRARRLPAPNGRLDQIAQAVSVAAIIAWIAAPTLPLSGGLLCMAGVLIIARLSRWRGINTAAEALVWILHVGYLWLGVALLLLGASVLAPGVIPRTAGIHALGAGAIGVMTLAVMTRASLGHTGRALHANAPLTALYVAVNAAALVRVVSAFSGGLSIPLLTVSALLWCAAFLGFGLIFTPILTRRHARA